MHNGFVNIDNQKMSKSLQNFKTLRYVTLPRHVTRDPRNNTCSFYKSTQGHFEAPR